MDFSLSRKPATYFALASLALGTFLIGRWTYFQADIALALCTEISIYYAGVLLAGPILEIILKPKISRRERVLEKTVLLLLTSMFSLYALHGIKQKSPRIAIYEIDIIRIYSTEEVSHANIDTAAPLLQRSPMGIETLAVRRSRNSDELLEGVMLEAHGLNYALQKNRWTTVASQSESISHNKIPCSHINTSDQKDNCFAATFKGKDLVAKLDDHNLLLSLEAHK
ncbi:MAG: hypothetical protein PGN19_08105 [Pseudomonas oryzihabitans]